MKLKLITKDGETLKELTQQELEDYANLGIGECKKELAKQNLKAVASDSGKLEILIEYLGLK